LHDGVSAMLLFGIGYQGVLYFLRGTKHEGGDMALFHLAYIRLVYIHVKLHFR